jgi:hypothetical protein
MDLIHTENLGLADSFNYTSKNNDIDCNEFEEFEF